MNNNLVSKNIDISCIDFTDFSYSISPDREITSGESLTESITRYGILHPPLVKEIKHNSYIIVSGRKRLTVFCNTFPDEKSCSCFTVSARTPKVNTFSILLEEILIRREITPIERAFFLEKISSLANDSIIAREFLPRLNLPPDAYYIKQCLQLLDLEEPFIRAIHHGILNEKTARQILTLSARDRSALLDIIAPLLPSINYQQKLVNICMELAKRDNTTIEEILKDRRIQEIVNHQSANPPQKMKNLMHYLTRKHMPRYSLAEKEFKRLAASMKLPGNVSMNHTPFFEDDSVTLSINFSNRESVQNAWKAIKDAIGKQGN